MNLNIVGHHINISPAVRQHIASKLNHIFEHFKYAVSATARLTTDCTKSKAPHQKAEVIVHVAGKHAGKGKDIVVETTDTNLYKAINRLTHRLYRQVMRYKSQSHASPHSVKKSKFITDDDVLN